MARTTPGETRQRLLDAALELFAANGFDKTSVGEIQVACGLARGSGALYKHFPAKRAVLEEAVSRHLERMHARCAATLARLPDDPQEALRAIGDSVWEVIADDRALIRIMLRDFDAHPVLFEQMWQGVLTTLFGEFRNWLMQMRSRGTVAVTDSEAAAAVLVNALISPRILAVLIGEPMGGGDPERYLASWVRLAAQALRP